MKKTNRPIALLMAAVMTIAIMLPFIPACAESDYQYSDVQIDLYVDLHGWMPTLNKEATAENPTVFQSPQIIADAFMEMYPNIKIRWARTKPVGGDQSDLAEWFTTQINAGTVPAIAFSWGTQYQERGWYLDLDEYLDKPNPYVEGNVKWRDLFPSYIWSQSTISTADGKVVAIPIALYPGPATGYYYNKAAFADAGIENPPSTWEELIADAKKLDEKGYRGVTPWGFNSFVAADSWVAQFCMGPSAAGYIMDKTDIDGNGTVDTMEQLRGVKAGLYNPVEHDYAREYFFQQKRYFSQVLPEGWENTDIDSLWNKGKLGMKEEGLWAMQNEHNNKARDFEFGVFPAPLMSKDTTEFAVEIEYTENGPYQPSADLQLNIMKPAVEGKPEVLDAAIRFLQFLTTPENNGMMILENGSDIGAVKGADVPPLLRTWLNQPFPKIPNANWPMAFTAEYNQAFNRTFEEWVKGQSTDEEFFAKINELQQKGADDYITKMGIDTTGW